MGVPGEFSHVVRTHKMLYPSLLFLNPARPGAVAAKSDIYLPACSDDVLSCPLNSWPRMSHFPRRGISYRGKGQAHGGGRGGLRSSGGMEHVGMTVWRDTQGIASQGLRLRDTLGPGSPLSSLRLSGTHLRVLQDQSQ